MRLLEQAQVAGAVVAIDERRRRIRHVISTATLDLMNRVVDVEGWDLSRHRANPVVLRDHSYDTTDIIGRAYDTAVEGNALVSTTEFAQEGAGAVAYALVKARLANAWSVGWKPRAVHEFGSVKGCAVCIDALKQVDYGWHHTRSELLEYSLVSIPAQKDAVHQLVAAGVLRRAEAVAFLDSHPAPRPSRRPYRMPGSLAASFEKARHALEQRATYRAARRAFEFRYSPRGRAIADFRKELKSREAFETFRARYRR